MTIPGLSLSRFEKLPPHILLFGGTGQAKVIKPIVEYYGSRVIAVIDETPGISSPFPDIELIPDKKHLKNWLQGKNTDQIGFSITIGNPHGQIRCELQDLLSKYHLKPVTLMHPTAYVDPSVLLGNGCQVLAGAIINPEVKIGRQCIINTKASVDHECILEDGVELAPGSTLCGSIHIEENVWIGAGATVLPRLRIGKNAIIGAGAVITKDVAPNTTIIGIPGKLYKNA
jgi:sugar O-acyltransferase (sialic acid O-acetyltransferase NeuD family)